MLYGQTCGLWTANRSEAVIWTVEALAGIYARRNGGNVLPVDGGWLVAIIWVEALEGGAP